VPRLRKARALRPGATFGIAAPGSPVDAQKLESGEALLREAGFRVLRRDDLLARRGYLAGDDARRAKEFMELVADERVDAVLCARGGVGCDRIIPLLDAAAVRAARKPLVGYSDVTALLLWQRRCAGLMGFHGPMLDRGTDVDRTTFAHLLAQLRGDVPLPVRLSGKGLGGGRGEGRLIGGSLTLLASSLGTPWEVETRGAIVLLEDVGERPYRIDRMLQQLRAAGKLERAAGIGLGAFASCTDERYPEPDVDAVLEEVLRPLGLPLVCGLPFGHVRTHVAWPLGARATLDGERGDLRVLERGVSRTA
jgi:muramoyltetrapeptide carboxypeptidase